jgi:hypothetical protein
VLECIPSKHEAQSSKQDHTYTHKRGLSKPNSQDIKTTHLKKFKSLEKLISLIEKNTKIKRISEAPEKL